MKHSDNYVESKKQKQLKDILLLFNKVLNLVGDYENDVKNLHYHDDKKIEYFDKIREVLYDYSN